MTPSKVPDKFEHTWTKFTSPDFKCPEAAATDKSRLFTASNRLHCGQNTVQLAHHKIIISIILNQSSSRVTEAGRAGDYFIPLLIQTHITTFDFCLSEYKIFFFLIYSVTVASTLL